MPAAPHWDERYEKSDVPWDTGVPDLHLVEFVDSKALAPGRVLEVGCGTGTNAIWLASRGFEVLGIDISPRAIAAADAKLRPGSGESVRFNPNPAASRPAHSVGDPSGRSDLDLRFEVLDFFDAALTGTFEFVFDRGVMHLYDDVPARAKFAARVAELLSPSGVWLSLVGCTEGPPRDHGPPRRSALDLVAAIEPVLAIHELRTTEFHANIPTPATAWLLQARQRTMPAQPPSHVGH